MQGVMGQGARWAILHAATCLPTSPPRPCCSLPGPQACEAAGFGPSTDVYVASGLLSSKDQRDWQRAWGQLKHLAGGLHYKERHLSARELEGLHPEQQVRGGAHAAAQRGEWAELCGLRAQPGHST